MAKTVLYQGVSYARLSKDKTGRAPSIENQLEINRRLSEQHGIPIVEEIVDRDESASAFRKKNYERPGWTRLLQGLRTGKWNVPLVADWDRGSREGIVGLAEVIEAMPKDGRFITGTVGELNFSHSFGRLSASAVSEIAAGYAEAISGKTKIGLTARAKTKPHAGGYEPYGHRTDGTIIEEEAAHIRQMFDWLTLEGLSPSAVAKRLNEQGVTAKRGGPWSGSSVSLMFRQPRMSGYNVVEIEDEPVRFKVWVPILSEEEHTTVLAALAESSAQRKARVSTGDTALLRGLLRCPACKQNLAFYTMQNRGKELPRYKCNKRFKGVPKHLQKGCEVSISQPFADAYVTAFVAAAHGTALSPLQHSPDLEVEERKEMLRVEMAALTERDEVITEEMHANRYAPRKWQEDHRTLLARISEAEAQLGLLEREEPSDKVGPGPDEDAAAWFAHKDRTVDEKRAALLNSLLSVDLLPATGRSMEDRLVPHFRFGRELAITAAIPEAERTPDEVAADEQHEALMKALRAGLN